MMFGLPTTRRTKPGRRPTEAHRGGLEQLEGRQFFSATSLANLSSLATDFAQPQIVVTPAAANGSAFTGYTPAQIRHAYGFDQVAFSGGVSGTGAGQTIAIVDAYNDPNIAADLAVFDQKYGIAAPPSLSVVNQLGGAALPATNAGWAGEIALDVEWAHAIAPAAKILLVEANSSSLSNLLAAVDTARNAGGVSVVSISWGSTEFASETAYDSYFTTPANHIGVTFVAAAGDQGSWSAASWPAASPNLLSVGGTTLNLQDAAGTYGSESGWSNGGGGTSSFEATPSYQSGVATTGTTTVTGTRSPFGLFGRFGFGIPTVAAASGRSSPDVAYNADPNTGFAVYDSVPDQGYSGWQVVGGTSAGAPQWAALVAIADQGRSLQSLPTLSGASQTLASLYSQYTPRVRRAIRRMPASFTTS